MGSYLKLGGQWFGPANRVYRKINGVWLHADQVHRKVGGVWQLAHDYDNTPPPPPVISLEIVETQYDEGGKAKAGRYIRVGVRQPGTSNDPDVKLIRILASRDKMPTTPLGQGFHNADVTGTGEPWSEHFFNGYGGKAASANTSFFQHRNFPPTATKATNLAAGTYYFAAWAMDFNGNWSPGIFGQITLPKRGVDTADQKIKEAKIRVNNTGTWSNGRLTYGWVTQATGPVRRGLFFYGNQIKRDIGQHGKPKIRKAQILLQRIPNDGGRPQANVYMATHNAATATAFAQKSEWGKPVKLGQIGIGEHKWFDIPAEWYEDIENDRVKGFILLQKDPNKAQANPNDVSTMESYLIYPTTGELHVVWVEKS